MNKKDVLKKLMERENRLFNDAAKFWKASIILNFTTFSLSFLLACVTKKSDLISWAIGFIALISPTLVVILREKSLSSTRDADRLRRALFYTNSLGSEIPSELLTEVHDPNTMPSQYVSPFFSSRSSQGVRRLLENCRENAFFTYKLAGISKGFALYPVIIMSLLLIVFIYTVISRVIEVNPPSVNNLQILGKSVAAMMSFIMAGDIFIIFYKYWEIEKDAASLFRAFDNMLKRQEGSVGLNLAMQAVEEYNLTIMLGPPILSEVHHRYVKQLSNAYREAFIERQENVLLVPPVDGKC